MLGSLYSYASLLFDGDAASAIGGWGIVGFILLNTAGNMVVINILTVRSLIVRIRQYIAQRINKGNRVVKLKTEVVEQV